MNMKRSVISSSFTLIFVFTTSVAFGQKMTKSESQYLYDQTSRLDLAIYENLIMLNLTQDTNYYYSAMDIVQKQHDNIVKLEKTGSGDEFFFMGLDMLKSINESSRLSYSITYYDDYNKKAKINNDEKVKVVKFKEKEYTISKSSKKNFDFLLEELEKSNKHFQELDRIKSKK